MLKIMKNFQKYGSKSIKPFDRQKLILVFYCANMPCRCESDGMCMYHYLANNPDSAKPKK